MTERDDEMPVPPTPQDAARDARTEALLSLSSRPPASLDERIAARRKAGDRVLLPVPETAPAATPAAAPARWRRFVVPIGLAAAAAAIVFIARRGGAPDGVQPPASGPIAHADSTPASTPGSLAVDSPRDSPAAAESSLAPGLPRPSDVRVGLGAPRRGTETLYEVRLATWRESAVDSAAAAVRTDVDARITVRYPADDPEQRALAEHVVRELVARGVAAARVVARERDPGALAPIGVTISVVRTP